MFSFLHFNCEHSSCAYHTLNCVRKMSFAALFMLKSNGCSQPIQLKGTNATSILLLSNSVKIYDVSCALKLSNISNVLCSSGSFSSFSFYLCMAK